jgi:hypothetical protein
MVEFLAAWSVARRSPAEARAIGVSRQVPGNRLEAAAMARNPADSLVPSPDIQGDLIVQWTRWRVPTEASPEVTERVQRLVRQSLS